MGTRVGAGIKTVDRIFSIKHTTLANQADWALGIVTGDNDAFITEEKRDGFEEIYKVKYVEK